MSFKTTKVVSEKEQEKMLKKLNTRFQKKDFLHDAEYVRGLSLKDLNEHHEVHTPNLNESTTYLLENHRLTPLYRRFISPRKLIGKLIDKAKGKFYYETHYFIGAIVEKQERLNQHIANAFQKITQSQSDLKENLTQVNSTLTTLNNSVSELSETLKKATNEQTKNSDLITKNAKALHSATTQTETLETYLKTLKQELTTLNENHQSATKEITTLTKKAADQSLHLAQEIEKAKAHTDQEVQNLKYPKLNFNYVGFEKKFYGNFDSLQSKHAQYLPYLEGCNNILDIGCGSGAFLGVLKKHGITGKGIDNNESVIEDCSQHDIEAHQGDAIEYLRTQPDNHFDGISCFHVIEHMHPQDFLEFLTLCHQKLQPEKYLLLETPNTSMLGIFNKGFYMDLTHVRPVHPETAEFLLKDMGFASVEIKTSSQLPDGDRLKEVNDPEMNQNIHILNKALFGDQDVSIIAKK